MERVVTVRLLNRFDQRIDFLRRTHMTSDPIAVSMVDEFDQANALFLVAYCEGEAIGSIRLSFGERTPMATWIQETTVEQGPHVVDFNRAVIAGDFRRSGLCRLLLVEAVIAAHRLGFKHAVVGIHRDSTLYPLFSDLGFVPVGGVSKCKHGIFESYVQLMEVPVALTQSRAHSHFRQAMASMQEANLSVRSMVPADLEKLSHLTPAGAASVQATSPEIPDTRDDTRHSLARAAHLLARAIPPHPAIALPPLPRELVRWQDQPWARSAVQRASAIAIFTPLLFATEFWALGMSPSVTATARLITAILIAGGLVGVLTRLGARWFGRDLTKGLWTQTLCLAGLAALISPLVYFVSGASGKQVAAGALVASVSTLLAWPLCVKLTTRALSALDIDELPAEPANGNDRSPSSPASRSEVTQFG
jgi:hypothetical protein